MHDLGSIKRRFGIIGHDPNLDRALTKAIQIAPTDISSLIIGESGVGKEFIPKIIHSLSHRKHNSYIAVNCGAIPEGTIDSELFGHEKGAFTGADRVRKGYFEVADKGSIFLDEVGELPLSTQVRLLRILETGEFMKVGSSTVQKTDIRILAATNVNVMEAVRKGKFREDLYYRLNTVQIDLPPLRDRKEDIPLLFRKFAADFGEKYHIPPLQLSPEASQYLMDYHWPGNIRQLRNFVEQLSVIEESRLVLLSTVEAYLPYETSHALTISHTNKHPQEEVGGERELLYKVLFDMKKDLNDLKTLTLNLLQSKRDSVEDEAHEQLIKRVFKNYAVEPSPKHQTQEKKHEEIYELKPDQSVIHMANLPQVDVSYQEINDESLSLHQKERELIIKALEKNKGKRKKAARELGISERTLYRKIRQFGI